MKSTTVIKTESDRQSLIQRIKKVSLERPIEVTARFYEKTRTSGMNSRYWSDLEYQLAELNMAIEAVSEHTGYTVYEVRKLMTEGMEPEQIAILFARTKEVVHEVLKMICGVPTSTKLGTKKFQKFELIMEQTIAEIVGTVKAKASKIIS